jgi:hypothetical protein
MDWYDSLVKGATVSLSKLFDPNYLAVRAATMQSPYSDSRGMSLQEMFQTTRPMLHNQFQQAPLLENGWDTNRVLPPPRKLHKYQGML